MEFVLSEKTLQVIDGVLDEDLLSSGATCALLVDRSGYLIANRGDPSDIDVVALAALSAANYGVTEEIARLVGEDNFSLLFHKGATENIHYTKIGDDFFLITLFNKDVSLGLMRLKTAKVKSHLLPILQEDN
ncbi:MAG: dynein regulation protein LC7 [Deltaproteobacteria bacterium]|nr:MAG: dynein regulation protein LC7 [Deltaproteobacteria bacterium]